jgi:DNA-binding transcriptional MerR regulator
MYSMWMAELAQRSGVSVPTIKYYLREGLLPPGAAVGRTRASYDESHVRRLRLIRALIDVAGLRLESVKHVVDGIDGARSWHEAVGSAHRRLGDPDPGTAPPSERSLARVQRVLELQDWQLATDHPQVLLLARALDTLDALDHPMSDEMLNVYAHSIRPIAANEVLALRDPDWGGTLDHTVEAVVIGTLLQEPILLALRRMAQEDVSRRLDESERWAGRPDA